VSSIDPSKWIKCKDDPWKEELSCILDTFRNNPMRFTYELFDKPAEFIQHFEHYLLDVYDCPYLELRTVIEERMLEPYKNTEKYEKLLEIFKSNFIYRIWSLHKQSIADHPTYINNSFVSYVHDNFNLRNLRPNPINLVIIIPAHYCYSVNDYHCQKLINIKEISEELFDNLRIEIESEFHIYGSVSIVYGTKPLSSTDKLIFMMSCHTLKSYFASSMIRNIYCPILSEEDMNMNIPSKQQQNQEIEANPILDYREILSYYTYHTLSLIDADYYLWYDIQFIISRGYLISSLAPLLMKGFLPTMTLGLNGCHWKEIDYFQHQEYPTMPILSRFHFQLLEEMLKTRKATTSSSSIATITATGSATGSAPTTGSAKGLAMMMMMMTIPYTSMAMNNFLLWDIYSYFQSNICNFPFSNPSTTLENELEIMKLEYLEQIQTMKHQISTILSSTYLSKAPLQTIPNEMWYTPNHILYQKLCCSSSTIIQQTDIIYQQQLKFHCQNFQYCLSSNTTTNNNNNNNHHQQQQAKILAENHTAISPHSKSIHQQVASYLPIIVESSLRKQTFCKLAKSNSPQGKQYCHPPPSSSSSSSSSSLSSIQDEDVVVFKRIYPSQIYQHQDVTFPPTAKQVQKQTKKKKQKMEWKVAVITAIYGNYEFSAKSFARQSIPTDFYVFTDREDLIAPGWIIDTFPYYLESLKQELETNQHEEINAYFSNQHPFNIAKYFKQSFHRIPLLQAYDSIIWIDGTISITNHQMAELITQIFTNSPQETMIVFEHIRNGSLAQEVEASKNIDRYQKPIYLGYSQPIQNIQGQYEYYLQNGYTDDYWKELIQTNQVNGDSDDATVISSSHHHHRHLRDQYGLWCTCFVAWNMKYQRNEVIQFLTQWSNENRKFSTQDQISFPYVAQMEHIHPYSLPDDEIVGSYNYNSLFVKFIHGM
jgi:hypothetical protein